MNEQSSKEVILQKTLHVLVRRVGLTPKEVSMLRLSDLHLAGKNPNITFAPAKDASSKTVELDLESHRALVGWLVIRPDSASEYLFLGDDFKPIDLPEIEQAVEAFEQADLDLESKPVKVDETKASSEPETPPADEDSSQESMAGRTTIAGSARPDLPPAKPASSAPPLSTPEMGAPPPGFETDRPFIPFPQPPPIGPEENGSMDAPEPLPATPFPPQKTRVPPKPIRKKDADGIPVIVQQKGPDQIGSEEGVSPALPVDTGGTQIPGAQPPETKIPPPKKEIKLYKSRKPSGLFAIRPGVGRSAMLSLALGGILIVLSVCVICVGGTGWFAVQSETGGELLAGLGFSQTEPGEDLATGRPREVATEAIPTEETPDSSIFESPVSPGNSPLATPTLPPTNTPTPLPPTNTPLPTETATPVPEVAPPPTDIPVPTDTPVPPDTPTPEPPTATPPPADTPTPEIPPPPTMKYEAPILLEPKPNFGFIAGNTLALRWQPVGELAPDEQYAVRMVYPYQNQITYQGGQTKSAEWVVPLSLYGQIDPPENRYEWFVVVERLNNDGSGTAISPESERWTFTWK